MTVSALSASTENKSDTVSAVSDVSAVDTATTPESAAFESSAASDNQEADSVAGRNTTSMPRTPTLQTTDALTEIRVERQLKRLSDYFTDGSYWNHYDIDTTGMSDLEIATCVTDTPCAHSVNGYTYCNVYNGAMATVFPQYDYDTQCLGYASLISDLLFGTDAPVTEFYDFDSLRIGDHIRLVNNEHSMIVTDIDWDTDTITVTEANADYENCAISWGRTITRDELYSMESDVRFYTRYS